MRMLRTILLSALLPAAAAAQTSAENLTFYGYINQGYGISSAEPILGLNTDGTGDYRAAALQVRYAISPIDNFVVQAGSRALGTSPYSSAPSAITLDWAFYHHRFDLASVRVGRLPVPFGFFSETRDVGTIVPFYRAPANFYLESFRSLDGLMATNSTALGGGNLETSVYGGGTNGTFLTFVPTQLIPSGVVTTRVRLERALGIETRYTTPIPGIQVRGGIASLRSLDTAKVQLAPASKYVVASVGLQAEYDRMYLRGETRRIKIASNQRQYSYYAQTGVRLASALWLNAQGDFVNTENYTPAVSGYVGRTYADRALGLSWHFQPNIVAKLEQHFDVGNVERYVPAGAVTPYTNYSIASFAVSF